MAMEALPIFLDRLTSPFLAIIMSVTLVLLFGEYPTPTPTPTPPPPHTDASSSRGVGGGYRIIPQALCSRYSLAIGAHLSGYGTPGRLLDSLR